ncbi:phosphatidate cytidylyltransferase [Flavobacterium arcticum]|uniref:Phosphatidate cytidylyltransferase n=1 Tax=Flavobacterium arcticum TaxID=1784713 RepID=A0A345HE99_9FLAO|nr:phosphatidate cytidylyltransferase [Flavobacterium arcticum]AXG74909.1 phosphatidate cytidylyltransferase [Flavobacterium arcticum]KAF2509593.1 phosphatidate cytidylyltransferase [Flavobacterium arcticum]
MNESIIRALSGIIYIILLLAATLYSPISFEILFGIFLIIAIIEFCRLVKLNVIIPMCMAIVGFIIFGYFINNNPTNNILLNVASIFVVIPLLIALFKKGVPVQRDKIGKLVVVTGYVIIPFLLIIKLPFIEGEYNPYIIVGMFILMWTNDTFAYIVGKSLGKHKLYERISPKKTIEGFAGGLVFTVIASYIISQYYLFLSPMVWIGTAVILVVFGSLGDLVESHFKRVAGVKDSGNIMPGHGGILDRLDSIIFAIPFLFLYYQIINYVS